MGKLSVALASLLWVGIAPPAAAECVPRVGVEGIAPARVAAALEEPGEAQSPLCLFVKRRVALDAPLPASPGPKAGVGRVVPWIELVFSVPSPVAEHEELVERQLERAVELVQSSPPGTWFQVSWEEGVEAEQGSEYAYLMKRAAVAIKGARPEAMVAATGPGASAKAMRSFLAMGVAGYVDAVVVHLPAGGIKLLREVIDQTTPGERLVVDAVPMGDDPSEVLLTTAKAIANGALAVIFDLGSRWPSEQVDLRPLVTAARELAGDISYAPDAGPSGAPETWTFVRSSDLGLSVFVDRGTAATSGPRLVFHDRALRSPVGVDPDGSTHELQARWTAAGLEVTASAAQRALVVRLRRASVAEFGGARGEVEVVDRYSMPVEEILRRLQSFLDSQTRRLDHYEATFSQNIRFHPGPGIDPVEATFSGTCFFRRGLGIDWVWREFFLNGVRWRGKIPRFPIVQPSKVALAPLEVRIDPAYHYTLRGVATVASRACWVVDYRPEQPDSGEKLVKGTVWVDQQVFAPIKMENVRLGLSGEVISSRETRYFKSIDDTGAVAPWSRSSLALPYRIEGDELQSVVSTVLEVEKEATLVGFVINGAGFSERLKAAWESQNTMVRETPEGLRYLVRQPDGTRVVEVGSGFTQWSLVFGGYYDGGLDFPVPLAGVNYFSSDVGGSGNQANVFFAGALLTARWADPELGRSHWGAGLNAFGFFYPRTDKQYRNGSGSPAEEVRNQTVRMSASLGRSLGRDAKLDLSYGAAYDRWRRSDNTAPEFVVPESTATQSLGMRLSYGRSGYRINAQGAFHRRSSWPAWGFPGNAEYDAAQRDYSTWRVSLEKTWWLGHFSQIGLSIEHLNGSDLDRFSKFAFGPNGGTRVGGYQPGLVVASRANGMHLGYGFNLGNVFRLGVRGDAVWIDDPVARFDGELLGGVNVDGSFIGPWQTIVRFDIGVAVRGPDHGVTASIVFLKLLD